MEASMKFAIPVAAALLLASPAFAQYSSPGNTSAPGASISKDDQTYRNTRPKKYSAAHKRHHSRAMNSNAQATTPKAKTSTPKAQTTGSGSSSAPASSVNKDEKTPSSK